MGTQGYVPIFSLHFSCVPKFKLTHYRMSHVRSQMHLSNNQITY